MPKLPGMESLIQEARRNEEIQKRLDQVEEFLLSHNDLKGLLRHLGRRVAQLYELETVTLALAADCGRLREALRESSREPSEGYFFLERKELRVILADLERPFLTNRAPAEVARVLFPGAPFVASLAVLPLWRRGEFLGTLNLGSASPRRYTPELETHFLVRLAGKVAVGLDAALVAERARLLEKSQAAVEMAGAACHELAQPLCTLELLAEKLARKLANGNCEAELAGLRRELSRLGDLVKNISQVSQYVTRPYAQGLRIIDVKAAAGEGTAAGHREESQTTIKDPDCIFCKIVAGEIPCFKLHEDQDTLAFLDINPLNQGHALVIPKAHHENLFAIAPEVLYAVHRAAQKVAGGLKKALGWPGLAQVQLNGPAAGQVVMHYHVHLIPRDKARDGLFKLDWEPVPGDMAELKSLAERIRAAL